MNELECIRAFVKTVEAGSFAEAARQTGVVKSVITKRVNQLEELLELQLLQRSTRCMNLTDVGANFYERCIPILEEFELAKSETRKLDWSLTGMFRVSCISSFSAAYLSNDICEFVAEHPELKIELKQLDRVCDPVQEGIDVCIQTRQSEGSKFECVGLFPLKRLIVATPNYIEKYGQPKKISDLKKHLIAHNNHIEPRNLITFSKADKKTNIAIEPQLLTNSIWLCKSAVMSGNYIAMMPAFFIEKEIISGEMVALLKDNQLDYPYLSAFYRKSSYLPMKLRIFINFLKLKYGEEPYWEKRILAARPELSIALSEE